MEKSIYGGMPSNPAGYCALHDGSLTVKEIKRKNCLGKQCRHLQKNEAHDYWRQRERMKQRKAESRKGQVMEQSNLLVTA